MTRLLLFQARRDRVSLPIWVLAIATMCYVSTVAVHSEFGTASARADLLRLALNSPALLALRGAPNGDSLGSTVFFQLFTWLAFAAGLMNTFFATRHGRSDEEQGRRELIATTSVSRLAPLWATLLLGCIANVALGTLATLGFIAAGLDVTGALLAGAALATTGLTFLGLGTLAGEVVGTGRAANAVGSVMVILAYVLRAIGDILGKANNDSLHLTPAWPTWLSPIGWGELTFAFSTNDARPLAIGVLVAVGAVTATVMIRCRRDVGASLVLERPGRPSASVHLRSPFTLAWRVGRSSLTAWICGSTLLGLAFGTLATVASQAVFDNPQVADILRSLGQTSSADMVTTFFAMAGVFIGVLGACAGLQNLVRLRGDESEGRADLQLAASSSRARWLLASVLMGVMSAVLVVMVSALAVWLAVLATDLSSAATRSLVQVLVQIPAALVFVAVGALALAAWPRQSIALTWGFLTVGVTIGLFGGLLHLPQAVMNLSPLTHVPTVPAHGGILSSGAAEFAGPLIVMTVLATGFIIAAVVLIRRRDLIA